MTGVSGFIFRLLVGDVGEPGVRGPTGPLTIYSGISSSLTGYITGAAGPAGPQGSAGITGVRGPVGRIGSPGLTGQRGVTGPAGLGGASGVTGPRGPTGQTGFLGSVGSPGVTGATGPQGATGTAGPGTILFFGATSDFGGFTQSQYLAAFGGSTTLNANTDGRAYIVAPRGGRLTQLYTRTATPLPSGTWRAIVQVDFADTAIETTIPSGGIQASNLVNEVDVAEGSVIGVRSLTSWQSSDPSFWPRASICFT